VSATFGLSLIIAMLEILAMAGFAWAGGSEVFQQNCATCHQSNAEGVVGLYPPLADSIGRYVLIPKGRAYLVSVVSFGMMGTITVHGEQFDGMMQPWQSLSDQKVADVLNFVLTRYNAKLLPSGFTPFTADEVKKDRAANIAMGNMLKEREALMKSLAAHHVAIP